MFRKKSYEIAITGLGMATVYVGTMIMIPNATGGYFNLGDGFILLFSSILSPLSSFFVGGVSSAMVDATTGYTHYVPYTLIIKGLEGVIVSLFFSKWHSKTKFLSYSMATFIMVGGYFLAKWQLKQNFIVALGSIPENTIQASVGIVIAYLLYDRVNKLVLPYKKKD